MRNFFCLVCVFFVFVFTLKAQKIDFGLKIGPNLSTVTGDLTENYNPRIGYHFGGFTEIKVFNKLSFKPEIIYNSMGYILNSSIENFESFDEPNMGDMSFKSAQRSNYLSVPMALKLNFSSRFGLEFGPQASFLLNSVSKLKSYQGFESTNDRNSYPGDFKLDYGAVLGICFSREKIVFQVRYYHGIADIWFSNIGNYKNYNKAIQLSFGYIFSKK